MLSKVVIALGLVSIMLPMLAYGQACTTAAQCTSGCCQLSPITYIFGAYSGTCAAAAPTEAQPCSSTCGCAAGLTCADNVLCRFCGKICMATDVYNRLLAYYNYACTPANCVRTCGGRRSTIPLGMLATFKLLEGNLPFVE